MSKLDRQLEQDRALRDAALQIVKDDVARVKHAVSVKNVGSRMATRLSEGAAELYDQAQSQANSHRGVLAALVAAIVIWFARTPMKNLLSDREAGDCGVDIGDDDIGDDDIGDAADVDKGADDNAVTAAGDGLPLSPRAISDHMQDILYTQPDEFSQETANGRRNQARRAACKN